MEFGLGLKGTRFGGVAGGDAIRGAIVAALDEGAGEDAPLDPPGIRIDEGGGIARRRQHQFGGLTDLLGAAFDRAVLAIAAGGDRRDYEQAIAEMIDGLVR